MKFLEKFKPFSGLHWTTTFLQGFSKAEEEHGFGMMITLLTLLF